MLWSGTAAQVTESKEDRERGREREKEINVRKKHQSVASHIHTVWGSTRNLQREKVREEGREKDMNVREKHQLVAFICAWTGDQICNPDSRWWRSKPH